MAINYNKLWNTLEKKGMTKYTLTHYFDISPRLITKLQHNEPINTTTLDKLCSILQCNVEDIITYEELNYNTDFRNEGMTLWSKKGKRK